MLHPLPCGAPGCLRYRGVGVYCLVHGVEWARSGERPHYLTSNLNSDGVHPLRVELLREAEGREPGFLLRHVQRLFDERLGPVEGPASSEARLRSAALEAARRDNHQYARERADARDRGEFVPHPLTVARVAC